MKTKINFVVLTSVICLLPIVLALAIYDELPQKMPMQWDFAGNPTWYAHKLVVVLALPLFFMALNIIVRLIFNCYGKKENISKVVRLIVEWLMPALSITIVPIMLYKSMGVNIPINIIVPVFVGALFVVLGNYLPKNRQNDIVGIRLPWTLDDCDNWNKTHRMAGILWIVCGIIMIVLAFLPLTITAKTVLFLANVALIVVVPVFYSYFFHSKNRR
jgi:uncharacterized membrane protein